MAAGKGCSCNGQGDGADWTFIQTLNELIDDQAKRLSALRNQIPTIVLLSLFGIAAIGGAFAGYAAALEPQRTRLPVYALGFLVSGIIMVILIWIGRISALSQLANNR